MTPETAVENRDTLCTI